MHSLRHGGQCRRTHLSKAWPSHLLRLASCTEDPHVSTEGTTLVSSSSLSSLLWHCAEARALSDGKLLHGIITEKHCPDCFLSNYVLHMYGKSGGLDDAMAVFKQMEDHDTFSWSAMIDAHARHGDSGTAALLMQRMQLEAAIPNKYTILSVTPACASPSSLLTGKRLHAFVVGAQIELDDFLGTCLIKMYTSCKALVCAHTVFDSMDECNRNVITWTAIAAAYAKQGKGKEAMQLFQQMLLQSFIPDEIFLVSIFDGCNRLRDVLHVHAYIGKTGDNPNVILQNALVNLYVKFGSLHHAWCIFQNIWNRTVVSWTTLISAYTLHGLLKEALQLFQQMLLECLIPDNVTFLNIIAACTKLDALVEGKRMHVCALGSCFALDLAIHNGILHLYGKSGSLACAQGLFDSMVNPDLVSWNAIISAYARHGQLRESFRLFHLMCQDGVSPDKVTFIALLDGCSREEALADGVWVHRHLVDSRVELDVVLETALIEMYGKCGSFDFASSVFENMPQRDLITWTAMMAACTSNEQNRSALELFTESQMQAILPNKVTYVSGILACANLADEKEGKRMHVRCVACDIQADVFLNTALVDLYGKCGNISEARVFFNNLMIRDLFSWNSMITAYAQHGYGEKALELFWEMQLEGMLPDEATLAVILCACNHAGLVSEAYNYLASVMSMQTLKPLVDHFIRLVDVHARAGQLNKGENLANAVPYQPCGTLWATLLGACSLHLDVDRGERIAYHAFELDPHNPTSYVALSNLYAAYEKLV